MFSFLSRFLSLLWSGISSQRSFLGIRIRLLWKWICSRISLIRRGFGMEIFLFFATYSKKNMNAFRNVSAFRVSFPSLDYF